MVFADADGQIYDDPDVEMAVGSGFEVQPVDARHLIPLPPGSDLLVLPQRTPVGFPRRGRGGRRPRIFRDRQAVAAFVAPAYTRLYGPAYESRPDAVLLPLYAYTAVGWRDGRFWVPALRVDPDPRQDPEGFDPAEIEARVAARRKAKPSNRLVDHLGDCALVRLCPAARNYFLDRWEAPLPSSPTCNARCLGCISEQPDDRTQTFGRIAFRPTAEEIAGVAVPHIATAPRPVVSFGQGCEGEPLVVADLLRESVRAIRSRTADGVINLNTNGSRPQALDEICAAGLDSVRISLPAVVKRLYDAYTEPRGFTHADVLSSVRSAHARGVHVSLNYFVFPGVSDREVETDALLDLCRSGCVDMVQLRNLNIDPELYLRRLGPLDSLGPDRGVRWLIRRLQEEAPRVRLGYFNPFDLRRAQ